MSDREITYREALNEALKEEMRRDSAVFLLGENIGSRGGSFQVTAGLLAEFGSLRVIDTPLAEAGFTGAGIGAAITGMRPVVELPFVDFCMLAMDQIVNQAAKFRFMTGFKGSVPLVIRTQGGCGNNLAAQHSQSLEALFYHIPGLKLVVPSNPYDAKGLLKTAIRDDNPVIFMEHKLLYATKGIVPQEEYEIPLGQAEIRRTGNDITIIAWSKMVNTSLEAAQNLAEHGINAEVIDLRTLNPLDKNTMLNSVRKTGRTVIAQEAVRRGGVASDIASIIQEEAFESLKTPVSIVAAKNTPVPFNSVLEKTCIPQVDDIVTAAQKLIDCK
jgi:pyruvate dehydrogenase E1 component beta subunit